MMGDITKIQEWSSVTRDLFDKEIVPLNKPAVLKKVVQDWPIVQAGRSSAEDLVSYLKAQDNGTPAYTIVGTPDINGRFFYSNDLKGVNFKSVQAGLTSTIEQLYALRENPSPHAVAIQSASIRDSLTGFDKQNNLPLLDESVSPTLWVNNRAIVAPHYDAKDNVACVVAGRRKFTLFPPDQIANLYVGPALNAPGGVPISLVELRSPDLIRFPRFADALAVAQEATLEPGDAIYMPALWWHGVESLEALNVLVNYWWISLGDEDSHLASQSLMHSMLTISKLSEDQREAWRQFFNYLVFKTDADPATHLPEGFNDIVTSLSPEQRKAVHELLKNGLD